MQTHWIVENITKESSYLEIETAIEKLGYPLQKIKGSFAFNMVDHYDGSAPVMFLGSIQMSKMLNNYLKLKGNVPNIYCTWENYLCTKYYPKFSEVLFNDNYVMVPYSEINRRKFFFYGLFGRESMMFIRPDDGDKSFKGGLIDLQDWDKYYEPSLGDNLAIVASPKNIRGEWRFICSRHGEIIAQSCYRYQGLRTDIPSAPRGATKLVEQILKVGYYPDSVFCVDICEDNDGNYWLLELNSFSSAGLYAADKEKIVQRVSEIALEDFKTIQGK